MRFLRLSGHTSHRVLHLSKVCWNLEGGRIGNWILTSAGLLLPSQLMPLQIVFLDSHRTLFHATCAALLLICRSSVVSRRLANTKLQSYKLFLNYQRIVRKYLVMSIIICTFVPVLESTVNPIYSPFKTQALWTKHGKRFFKWLVTSSPSCWGARQGTSWCKGKKVKK